uniref:Proline-rich protein n=1 Tax=Boechera divaricarpa TaxID=115915 RepID=B2BXT6_9BRAS|nr:proline-rich protein [Boechera divaricarpa]
MSGGFFRGTSAEQDTRFSNKQAKLMKSQKFAPELENLVDVTKVKMDVMKPWIATRVTELLGFEDEVLINFIYGLLDGKVVNGKEIQISLTGFMEKNTGKFMKELWTLLLSAQNNSSGVPQQFLDAREAETKKKQEEAIQKADREHDTLKKIDSGVALKVPNGMEKKPSRHRPEDGRRADEKNEGHVLGLSAKQIQAPEVILGMPSTIVFLNPKKFERKSRSLSRSSDASISPRKRIVSDSRRRSRSRSLHKSLSPRRRRIHSPYGSRSRSPIRHHRRPSPEGRRQSPPPSRRRRSPSPFRRRRSPSPLARRRRSPSPLARRRRSPSPPARRRRSPSPPARSRRSPSPPARRRRSPLSFRRRRSPSPPARRRRSPSPLYRRNRSRSPLAKRERSDSQGRSPSPVANRRAPTGARLPSLPAGQRLPSPPPRRAGSPSPMRIGGSHSANHLESPSPSSLSPPGGKKVLPSPPVRRRSSLTPAKERSSLSPAGRGEGESPSHVKQGGSMSPVRSRGRSSPSSHPKARSPVRRRSPTPVNRRSRRFPSASRSPDDRHRRRSPSSSRSSRSRSPSVRRRSPPSGRKHHKDRRSPGHPSEERDREDRIQKSKLLKRTSAQSPETDKRKQLPEKVLEVGRVEHVKEQERKSDKLPERRSSHRTHGSQMSPVSPKESLRAENSEGKSRPLSNKVKDSEQVEKEDNSDLDANLSSDSKENSRHRTKDKKRRKDKRSSRQEVSSDDKGSSDSDLEDRKEAKRRRKEEKKTRKEEKKRKREERRRKREERRGGKLKHKNRDHSDTSEGEEAETYPKNKKGEESDPKRLEIELRNKALDKIGQVTITLLFLSADFMQTFMADLLVIVSCIDVNLIADPSFVHGVTQVKYTVSSCAS